MAVDKLSISVEPPLVGREDRHAYDERRRFLWALNETVPGHDARDQERDAGSHRQKDEERFPSCETLHRLSPEGRQKTVVRVGHWRVDLLAGSTRAS